MKHRLPAAALPLLSMGLCAILAQRTGLTACEQKTAKAIPLRTAEYLTLRRNYFLGHREMSDILAGLDIIATTVDLFQNTPEANASQHVVRSSDDNDRLKFRFEGALENAASLSKFAIGMNEVYLLPAMYLAFEEEAPERALQILEYGMQDSRTDTRTPLLAAFLSHIFLRKPELAGTYYLKLAEHPKTPAWVRELGLKLQAGQDPIETDPRVQKNIIEVINNAFPRARAFFERNQRKREQRRKQEVP